MKEAKDIARIVLIGLLGLFVLIVVGGIVLPLITFLAILLIKIAVAVAIVYLVLVGIRALIR